MLKIKDYNEALIKGYLKIDKNNNLQKIIEKINTVGRLFEEDIIQESIDNNEIIVNKYRKFFE